MHARHIIQKCFCGTCNYFWISTDQRQGFSSIRWWTWSFKSSFPPAFLIPLVNFCLHLCFSNTCIVDVGLSLWVVTHSTGLLQLSVLGFPSMLRVKLPVVDRIHPQRNTFAMGVENKNVHGKYIDSSLY